MPQVIRTRKKEELRSLDYRGVLKNNISERCEACFKSLAALRTIGSGTEVAHEDKRCWRSIGIAGEQSGQFFHHFWIVKMNIREKHYHCIAVLTEHGLQLYVPFFVSEYFDCHVTSLLESDWRTVWCTETRARALYAYDQTPSRSLRRVD